jgi:hypothetical protein
MTADDRAYGERLGEVLRKRSVEALRAFLEAQAGRYGDERQVEAIRAQSDTELEMIMHRMTLARGDLAKLHADSERWLAAHGASDPGAGPSGPGAGAGPSGSSPGGGPSSRRPRPGGPQRRHRPPQA